MTVDREQVPLLIGKTIELGCSAIGVPTPSITWSKNDKPLQTSGRISVSDDGKLTIRDAVARDVGEYHCVGKSPAGIATAVVVLWSKGGS